MSFPAFSFFCSGKNFLIAGLLFLLLRFSGESFATENTNLNWAVKLPFAENIAGVAIKPNGHIMVCGNTKDASITGFHGATDVFIAECDALGSVIWAKAIGGSDMENADQILVRDNGYIVLIGETRSHDGNFSQNQANPGVIRSFVLWMNGSGDVFRRKYIFDADPGLSNTLTDEAIFSRNQGNIYLAVNESFISGGFASQSTYFLKLDTSGTQVWINYLNVSFNPGAQSVNSLHELLGGQLVACGSTTDVGIGFVQLVSPTGQSIPVNYGSFGWGTWCRGYLDENERYFVLHTPQANQGNSSVTLRSELLPSHQMVLRNALTGIDGNDIRSLCFTNHQLILAGSHVASSLHRFNIGEEVFVATIDSSFHIQSYVLESGEGNDHDPVLASSPGQQVIGFTTFSCSVNRQPVSSCGGAVLAGFTGPHNLLGVKVYFDENNNQVNDPGEGLVNKMICDSTASGKQYFMTNEWGYASISTDATTHHFSIDNRLPSGTDIAPGFSLTGIGIAQTDTLSAVFRIYPLQEVYDLEATLYAHGPIVPGQKTLYTAVVRNNGTRAISGRLQWGLSNAQSFADFLQGGVNFDTIQTHYLSGLFVVSPMSSVNYTLSLNNDSTTPGQTINSWIRVYDTGQHTESNVLNNTATSQGICTTNGNVQNATFTTNNYNPQGILSGQECIRFDCNLQNTQPNIVSQLVLTDSLPACIDPLTIQVNQMTPGGSNRLLFCDAAGVMHAYVQDLYLETAANNDLWSRFHLGYRARVTQGITTPDFSHSLSWKDACGSAQSLVYASGSNAPVCPIDTIHLSVSQCEDSVFSYGNLSLPFSGDYFFSETAAQGCQYMSHVQLQYFPVLPDSNNTYIICEGHPVNINGQDFTCAQDTGFIVNISSSVCPQPLHAMVYVLPKPVLQSSGDTVFCTTMYSINNWIDCQSGNSLGNAGNSYYLLSAGQQVAVVFDNGFCIDTTACLGNLPTKITSIEWPRLIWQENGSSFTLVFSDEAQHRVLVMDMQGKQMLEYNCSGSYMEIDASDLAAGIYLIVTPQGNMRWVNRK